MKTILLLVSFLLCSITTLAQWQIQPSGTTSRFRAISVVNNKVAWASGNNGSYARTTNGGKSWQSSSVPDATSLDFRDIYAVDANTAYLLSIGTGEMSRIYKTTNGGQTWLKQYTNTNPQAFFDCMAFWDTNNGIAFSDPVDGHFPIITTTDGGAHWQPIAHPPAALAGESAFAASGTSITVQGKTNAWIATGGQVARVLKTTDRGQSWVVADTPIISGSDSTGIFSIAFRDNKNGVIVGGDYKKLAEAKNNVAITTDGGISWQLSPGTPLTGYRSAVSYLPASKQLIAVGPTGTDYSLDGGLNWQVLSSDGYHSFAPSEKWGWAVGEEGKIGIFFYRSLNAVASHPSTKGKKPGKQQ